LLQDLEVAAEFHVRESVSVLELVNKLAETNHVKVGLLAILTLVGLGVELVIKRSSVRFLTILLTVNESGPFPFVLFHSPFLPLPFPSPFYRLP